MYMPMPNKEMWLKIANDFKHKWHYLNCLGAIDGKHVSIRKPIKSGSEYYYYKQYFSIVLMAAVDLQITNLYS